MTPKDQHEILAMLAELDSEMERIKWTIEDLKKNIHSLEKMVLYEVGDNE